MKTILTLVLFLVIGFIGAKGWVSRVRTRSPFAGLFITGIEFFFLGIVLGPLLLNIISNVTLREVRPAVYLALGWAGLLFGIQLSWIDLKRVSRPVYTALALDTVLCMLLFAGVFFALLSMLVPLLSPLENAYYSIIFAITASISSPTLIAVLARALPARGKFTGTVKVIASLNALLPLFAFGIFFIITHPGISADFDLLTGVQWWVFANAVGVVLGFVMVLLTRQRCSEDERLLLIIGFVMLSGGVCYFLKLSSLYTAMLMGIVVGNFSRRKDQIFQQLLHLEKTIYIVFLILLGAFVSLIVAEGSHGGLGELLSILGAYLLLRLLLKVTVTGGVMRRVFPDFHPPGRFSGIVFMGQGGMALAMVLDYWMTARGTFLNTFGVAVVLAVVVNEIAGYVCTREALLRSGEASGSGSRPAGRGNA